MLSTTTQSTIAHAATKQAAIVQSAPPHPLCHVHKFGGSSLADAAHYRAVAALIADGARTRVHWLRPTASASDDCFRRPRTTRMSRPVTSPRMARR